VIAQDYVDSLDELKPLLDLITKGSLNRQSLVKAGFDPDLLSPAIAGSVVLLVSRFERFLKDIANGALSHFGKAAPAISRSQLPHGLQVQIISKNIGAAVQRTRYGQTRTAVDRISSVDRIANRIVADDIWGDDAIDTYSNPNSETVRSILSLLGVAKPWEAVETEFATVWTAQRGLDNSLKSIPSASAELESVLVWRNTAAHTGRGLLIGPHEVKETLAFLECLGLAIDEALKNSVEAQIVGLKAKPGAWS